MRIVLNLYVFMATVWLPLLDLQVASVNRVGLAIDVTKVSHNMRDI